MVTEARLEAYLALLDKALGSIPLSHRSDIITEIKAHILDTQENEPHLSMDDILATLGEPASVAKKYLVERGLGQTKEFRTPPLKWAILSIGVFAVLSFAFIVVSGESTPYAQNPGLDERVKSIEEGATKQALSGMIPLNSNEIKKLSIPFNGGSIDVEATETRSLEWNCLGESPNETASIRMLKTAGSITLDLSAIPGTQCRITVPATIPLHVKGVSGQIGISKARAAVDVSLQNGTVAFEQDEKLKYAFDLKTNVGLIDNFQTSSGGILVKIAVNNGVIRRKG